MERDREPATNERGKGRKESRSVTDRVTTGGGRAGCKSPSWESKAKSQWPRRRPTHTPQRQPSPEPGTLKFLNQRRGDCVRTDRRVVPRGDVGRCRVRRLVPSLLCGRALPPTTCTRCVNLVNQTGHHHTGMSLELFPDFRLCRANSKGKDGPSPSDSNHPQRTSPYSVCLTTGEACGAMSRSFSHVRQTSMFLQFFCSCRGGFSGSRVAACCRGCKRPIAAVELL